MNLLDMARQDLMAINAELRLSMGDIVRRHVKNTKINVDRAATMRRQGMSYRQIGDMLGCSKVTVMRALNGRNGP